MRRDKETGTGTNDPRHRSALELTRSGDALMRTDRTDPDTAIPDRAADMAAGTADADRTATEARQGGTGRPVLAVLVGGVALALLVWAGVEYYGSQLPGNTPGNEATVAQPSTESGDGLENDVPLQENPNGAATRQAVPSTDGSPLAKGQGEGPRTTTNDGGMPATDASASDPGSATNGGTGSSSPTP